MTYTAIHAQITGSDTAMPKAISAHGNTPVLTLCRKLVEAGIDPTRRFSVCGRLAE